MPALFRIIVCWLGSGLGGAPIIAVRTSTKMAVATADATEEMRKTAMVAVTRGFFLAIETSWIAAVIAKPAKTLDRKDICLKISRKSEFIIDYPGMSHIVTKKMELLLVRYNIAITSPNMRLGVSYWLAS